MASAFDSNVDVTIEIAPGFDPLETPTWTDITQYARGFSTRRGKSRRLGKTQAGEATIRLSNTDSRFDPNNSSGPYTALRPLTPVRILAEYDSTTYPLYRGFTRSWPQDYPNMKDSIVDLRCVDGFRILAMVEQSITESEELSGTRIGNLLDVAGWPAGWRNLDAGTHTVAALTSEFNTALGEIRRTQLVENGIYFHAGDGDATFFDGNHRIEDDSIQATFSDDGSDSEYSGVRLVDDEEQIWNNAEVTRTGGTTQTSTDSTSVDEYGQRDLHLSETLHVSDGEALALADWIVMEMKDVRTHVPFIQLKPQEDPTQLWPEALGLEIWDKVNVERTPPGGTAIDLDYYIEGVSHSVQMVGGRSWSTTLQLSPDLPFSDWWILGTAQLGTDTRLGY